MKEKKEDRNEETKKGSNDRMKIGRNEEERHNGKNGGKKVEINKTEEIEKIGRKEEI